MNLITVLQRFPDQEACIEHLEEIRWNHTVKCPYCESDRVRRKADGYRQGRWNCHACHSSFNVLSSTIFQKTKIRLQKWFLAICTILDAKESVSSHQLARYIGVTQPTAWYMGMRIRHAMDSQGQLLREIVEAGEAYIGGKPRNRNRKDRAPAKDPRSKSKLTMIGAVERDGKAIAHPSASFDTTSVSDFLTRNTGPGSLLTTEGHAGCSRAGKHIDHASMDHPVQFSDGLSITNTIRRFWSLLKRAWHWTHHRRPGEYAGANMAEAYHRYNARSPANGCENFIQVTVPA